MPKITIFVFYSCESTLQQKSVRYKRVNRNTVRFKGSAAYNRQFNGSRDAFHIPIYGSMYKISHLTSLLTLPVFPFSWVLPLRSMRLQRLTYPLDVLYVNGIVHVIYKVVAN